MFEGGYLGVLARFPDIRDAVLAVSRTIQFRTIFNINSLYN
jgi:hypothetical protein